MDILWYIKSVIFNVNVMYESIMIQDLCDDILINSTLA